MASGKLSKLVQELQPSPTLAVDARAAALRRQGRSILGLGSGEPDFGTPAPIREAAIAAIEAGVSHYTAVAGTEELRGAIIRKLARDQGLEFSPQAIVVSNGAKHSLYNVFLTLLEPGDEVVIPAPYWVSYPAMVRLAGALPLLAPTTREAGYKLGPAQLRSMLADHPRAKMLVMNSPCNPSGAVYSRAEWEALLEVVSAHSLWLVSDEIYEKILYEQAQHFSPAQLAPELSDRTIIVNGVSKVFAMTGWRIGYIAAPEAVAGAVVRLQGQTTGNASALSQAAAAAALGQPPELIQPMLAAYTERRRLMVDGLNQVEGIRATAPDGTFYAFAEVGEWMAARGLASANALATHMLDGAGVAAVPGDGFGMPATMRFSFAAAPEVIGEALERLAELALSGRAVEVPGSA